MAFQTVFYFRSTGKIINVVQNKYIRSKAEKSRFCPGFAPNDVSFLYFKSSDTIGPETHRVMSAGPVHPVYIVDADGIPLVFTDKRRTFINLIERFPIIIVDLYLSMGDNLLRAAAVAAAQVKYQKTRFFCAVNDEFRPVMSLCPEITLFDNYIAQNLDPRECGKVMMGEGPLWDPRGPEFGKASLYGLYLNLAQVPYKTTLRLPPDFDKGFIEFSRDIGLRADGHNVMLHLRSKDWTDKCWETRKIDDLAHLIKSVYDCTIFYLGATSDLPGDHPDLVNLCGKTTWLQTVYLLTKASKIICVDSAVMHLSRALGLPYFCLWGHTTPDLILSQPPGPGDIMAPPKKGRQEMQDITPLQVFNRAFPNSNSPDLFPYDPAQDFSDFGGQAVIFKYFSAHPPAIHQLVDLGAHGKNSSNSYGLLALGWKGLLVEANPERVKIIRNDFAGLNVNIVQLGVSDEAGRMPLYLHAVVGSSSLLEDWDPHEHTGKKIMVTVEPVDKIFRDHQVPDDLGFLSIDLEGLDYRVMKCIFEKTTCRPQLIITEAASYPDPKGFFYKYGYDFLTQLKQDKYGNLIFYRKE